MHVLYALLALSLTACVSTGPHDDSTQVPAQVKAELAPTGTLRVGLNLSTDLLASRNPATGELSGIAIDIARELSRRTGLPVRFIGYSTGQLEQKIDADEWDIAFFAVEPARAKKVSFSPPYAEIETTYLVRKDAAILRANDVDLGSRSVAVSSGAGYESMLASRLKHARLVRTKGFAEALQNLNDSKVDAISGLKPSLVKYAESHPEYRVVEGRFGAVQQAIGIRRGNDAADAYLRSFITDLMQSGHVARFLAANKTVGLTIPK